LNSTKLFFSQFDLPFPDAHTPYFETWRQTHLGRLLAMAGQRFDARVLALMAHNADLGLALSNLAARGALGASHIQMTRHLPLAGCSLTELASRAGITKQAMGKLVDQCAAWDLVQRQPDARDARALRVVFTASGRLWLEAYQRPSPGRGRVPPGRRRRGRHRRPPRAGGLRQLNAA
jgi:DNA-binding MarR family transcriptional regulator